MTLRERHLEAPHKRLSGPSRLIERTAVLAYRAGMAVFAHLPPALTRPVVAAALQASYLVWPTKRRWSNANFGHVLGLAPDDRRVRALALRAYSTYARYVVELLRLPARAAKDVHALEMDGVDEVVDAWRARGGPLIVTVAHLGNNEACAAAIAHRGFPVSVVADDTAFPELFALLRAQRKAWGVDLIPWRNLRGIYDVLKRDEILGLLVDWGYRPDGVPVRLFDAWTTLPAGPAALAAKFGGSIVPVRQQRTAHGRFRLAADTPIEVASSEPAEILRATQAIADSLQRAIAAAPEQWYSFKPMWPPTDEEAAELEARAARMLGGPASRAGVADATESEPPAGALPGPVTPGDPELAPS